MYLIIGRLLADLKPNDYVDDGFTRISSIFAVLMPWIIQDLGKTLVLSLTSSFKIFQRPYP